MFEELMEKDVNPLLTNLVKQFIHKTKRNLIVKANSRTKVWFFDAMYPTGSEVGWVAHNGGEEPYEVSSRLIINNRYKGWRREHHQQSTKDPKKALNIMVNTLLPFSPHEISKRTYERPSALIDEWVKESRHAHHNIFAGVDSSILLEEVRHMQAMGYAFKTAKFQKMAEEGLEAHREYETRRNTKFLRHHIYIRPDKVVQVHTRDNGNEPTNVELYPTEEHLPEHIKTQIGMLRIVGIDDEKGVPEVGVCVSENEFWVLEKIDTSGV
jgi:hypothetical protein